MNPSLLEGMALTHLLFYLDFFLQPLLFTLDLLIPGITYYLLVRPIQKLEPFTSFPLPTICLPT